MKLKKSKISGAQPKHFGNSGSLPKRRKVYVIFMDEKYTDADR